jgi:hypothetical protein
MRRTKPYAYALFNLEAMAAICQLLSTPEDNLWMFELADGRGMRRALAFMAPHIRDKRSWPLKPDVMYDREWPMRHSSLLFAGLAFGQPELIELWKTLKADSTVEEVIRNFFIRQPVLWVSARIGRHASLISAAPRIFPRDHARSERARIPPHHARGDEGPPRATRVRGRAAPSVPAAYVGFADDQREREPGSAR